MCEKEIETEMDNRLSEKEDLIAQLDEQDRIMKMMQRELEKYKKEKDDYTQVVHQLQRQGKFLDEEGNVLCLIKILLYKTTEMSLMGVMMMKVRAMLITL